MNAEIADLILVFIRVYPRPIKKDIPAIKLESQETRKIH